MPSLTTQTTHITPQTSPVTTCIEPNRSRYSYLWGEPKKLADAVIGLSNTSRTLDSGFNLSAVRSDRALGSGGSVVVNPVVFDPYQVSNQQQSGSRGLNNASGFVMPARTDVAHHVSQTKAINNVDTFSSRRPRAQETAQSSNAMQQRKRIPAGPSQGEPQAKQARTAVFPGPSRGKSKAKQARKDSQAVPASQKKLVELVPLGLNVKELRSQLLDKLIEKALIESETPPESNDQAIPPASAENNQENQASPPSIITVSSDDGANDQRLKDVEQDLLKLNEAYKSDDLSSNAVTEDRNSTFAKSKSTIQPKKPFPYAAAFATFFEEFEFSELKSIVLDFVTKQYQAWQQGNPGHPVSFHEWVRTHDSEIKDAIRGDLFLRQRAESIAEAGMKFNNNESLFK